MILPLSSEAGRAIRGGNFTLRLLGMAAGGDVRPPSTAQTIGRGISSSPILNQSQSQISFGVLSHGTPPLESREPLWNARILRIVIRPKPHLQEESP